MIKALISTTLLLFFSLLASAQDAPQAVGHDYVVQSGDGLYSLGRKFFNKGVAYKKIIKAHNKKAATDKRYTVINDNSGLEVGQLMWIPLAGDAKPVQTTQPAKATIPAKTVPAKTIPAKTTQKPVVKPVVKKKPLWKKAKPSIEPGPDASALPKSEQATIVTLPITNCQIRIWYNYQIVAILKLNLFWQANGLSLEKRAQKAYQIRHDARISGRFMMSDSFEVAALRDRDNKKYGNPNGPSFDHLLNFTKEKGFEGDAAYQAIIESTSRTRPVFNSSCKENK
jgi:hypothetical protein